MDPVSLILGALAAGAADTTKQAVKDAYDGLKRLVAARFAGRPPAEVALAEHADDPETWQKPLAKELDAAGAAGDDEILAAARAVLEAADPAGAAAGKYILDLRGAQGVQVGDHSQQLNQFGGGGVPGR
jgi:hypothetical protein